MHKSDTKQQEEQSGYTVSEVTRLVKATLEKGVPPLWVIGEISNFSRPRSGHLYMTLKDASSQLSAVMWRGAASRLRFDIKDGLQVRAFGRIAVYEPRGQYQIVLEKIEPQGVGALELAFRQLHERLKKEGLFDERHKKQLPFLPRAIGIVTSPTGAAIRDMLDVIHTRFPNAHVKIHPVRVQGNGSAEEVAAAIDDFNRRGDIDVMIVGRGGGSLEDLWAFNEEVVARAIFDSTIPIISAVGHEIDVSISDLVADTRALTPTAAGQMVVPIYDELIESLGILRADMDRAIKNRLTHSRQQLDQIAQRRVLADPLGPILQFQQRLDELSNRSRSALRFIAAHNRQRIESLALQLKLPTSLLREHRHRLDTLGTVMTATMKAARDGAESKLRVVEGKLSSLNPLAVLARGYSITTRSDTGETLTDTDTVTPGTELITRLHQGRIRSTVTEIMEKADGQEKENR